MCVNKRSSCCDNKIKKIEILLLSNLPRSFTSLTSCLAPIERVKKREPPVTELPHATSGTTTSSSSLGARSFNEKKIESNIATFLLSVCFLRTKQQEVAIKSETKRQKKYTFPFFLFPFCTTRPKDGINLEFCSGNVAPHFNKSDRAGIKNFYEPLPPPPSPPSLLPTPVHVTDILYSRKTNYN